MARISLLLGIISLAAAASVLAQQAQPAPEQAQPKPQPAQAKTFLGEVVSVDATAKTVTVKESKPNAPENSMTFAINEQTKIGSPMAGAGQALKLADLKKGDRVTVKYTASAGKHVAELIEVVAATSSN
jgi:Cu/Ag efflux protein CusF